LEISIIFPHQLFQENPAIAKGRNVVLIEEYLFFQQYAFHQQKILLHRASMQFYKAYLEEKGFHILYEEAKGSAIKIEKVLTQLFSQGYWHIHYVDVVDNWLQKAIDKTCNQLGIRITKYSSPLFMNTIESTASFFDSKKSYFQTDFYIWQRKQRQILIEKDGKPTGGKWTFDAENRSSFPKQEIIPTYPFPNNNKWVIEAQLYVKEYYHKNYGSITSFFTNNSFYPTTFTEASDWLECFLQQRFAKFGIYEDAMVANESILYHSVLTPMLNIGLLTPNQVIKATLDYAAKTEVPINSLEGFIRQIIGWREFIRVVYEREGTKQRTTNYWGFTRKIPDSFYNGTTGIVPIDDAIKKVLKTGYNHHIERLMILGNFMLLCEFDPNEVYRWFMEMYIDSYDWVMVPNVYGMTQFADGGLMTTKPYISGSNYIMKMSNYAKGSWQETWDGLFWRFMHVHRNFFLSNPRLGMLVGTFDKMSVEKREKHLQNAQHFLHQLDK